jgi:hypothetical protein
MSLFALDFGWIIIYLSTDTVHIWDPLPDVIIRVVLGEYLMISSWVSTYYMYTVTTIYVP